MKKTLLFLAALVALLALASCSEKKPGHGPQGFNNPKARKAFSQAKACTALLMDQVGGQKLSADQSAQLQKCEKAVKTSRMTRRIGTADQANIGKKMSFTLINNAGAKSGTIDVTQAAQGLIVVVNGTGFAKGWHAMHIHTSADVSDTAKFLTAGGHLQVLPSRKHGLLHANHELADFPNVYAGDNGEIHAAFYKKGLSLTDSHLYALQDENGSSIVIHANPDDYTTPSGGAGARIAAAAIPAVSGVSNKALLKKVITFRYLHAYASAERGPWGRKGMDK